MYTHARQFPHLAGMDDPQIRELVVVALLRRPRLYYILQARRNAVLLGMIFAIAGLARNTDWELRSILLGVCGVAGAFVLCWNLIWVNTVTFRITREDVEEKRHESARAGRSDVETA